MHKDRKIVMGKMHLLVAKIRRRVEAGYFFTDGSGYFFTDGFG